MTSNVNEHLEKLTKAKEKTQEQIALLQQEVTISQEESTKWIVRKLDDERKLSFKKVGNEKQFCFNQRLEQHLDAAQHKLSKIDTSSMNEEVKKMIEVAREELKEGQQEVVARQKRIRLADHSEYGWTTAEAYNDDELEEDPADEKKMADAEKEVARKVTMKRKATEKGSYRGGDFRKRPFGDQVPATNPGPSKLPELDLIHWGPVGAVVVDLVTLLLMVLSLQSGILVKVMMCMYVMTCMYVITCTYAMLYMCQTYWPLVMWEVQLTASMLVIRKT